MKFDARWIICLSNERCCKTCLLFSFVSPAAECGDGWMKYEDTCVLVVGTRLTFDLAQEYCQGRHANLIKLESQDMNVSLHADIWLSIGLSGRVGLSGYTDFRENIPRYSRKVG